ncbi:NADH-quinone oxidoreductase subunit L [Lichenihabitans psoromatis]|uniref:NADH-quinone oxidoreductase subunit L n=1 Tax=Lichenihabitans psoromatis TaxID=2528642 RepID=UPI00103560A4|nr:NADH-quinone oxidoreductase subunit L [Lichenihabitans psoromatis]
MYQAIVFLPLVGFLITGLFGNQLGARSSEIVTSVLVGISALLSWVAFVNVGFGDGTTHVDVANWMTVGALKVDWAFRIDTLTVVMLVVVNTVSTLVHVYSIGYMHEDPSRPRFFAYLSLFTFAMLMLVTSDNLVQMFFGWEGVGLASYLLIGFWYDRPTANAAAIKAFVVNRVGDFGFSLGIFLVFALTQSVAFDTIFAAAPGLVGKHFHAFGMDPNALTLACLLLFMGAMGKSAQFLLHTWLPDAMEGPTPVSALIHAATMVTAGVFMVARLSPLFELAPHAMTFVTVIGGTTAMFAATIGLVQNDIKKVIAYSTCSQLGYMFVALGVGGYSLAVFHLFTHAFFKALLFLGAGSVIHACHHEQDMRKMGGLWRKIPITFAMMIIGTLALTGFPFTAGYFSKDAIIEASFASTRPGAVYAFLMVLFAAGMTSFYSWRLIFLTFFGVDRSQEGPVEGNDHNTHAEPAHGTASAHGHEAAAHDDHSHHHEPHESPIVMLAPLFVLAFGALFAGLIFKHAFIGEGMSEFWKAALFYSDHNHIFEAMEHVPFLVSILPTIMMVVGFLVAFYAYVLSPGTAESWAKINRPLYLFFLNKWYFDELYDHLFVRPAFWLGRLFWKGGDGFVIDGFGPDGVAAAVVGTTNRVVKLQTGYLYHYAFAMMLGVAAFITWYLVGGVH